MLAQRWHPDRHHGGDVRTFQVVQEAYSCLSDPVLRHSYDLRLLGLLDVEVSHHPPRMLTRGLAFPKLGKIGEA